MVSGSAVRSTSHAASTPAGQAPIRPAHCSRIRTSSGYAPIEKVLRKYLRLAVRPGAEPRHVHRDRLAASPRRAPPPP